MEDFLYTYIHTYIYILEAISFWKLNERLKNQIEFNNVLIFLINYEDPINKKKWKKLLDILTPNLVQEVLKYKRWQDQHNALLGKALIYLGYQYLTNELLNMRVLKRDHNNKPFLVNKKVDFNISHSGKSVVCALSKNVKNIGIDIEQVKHINVADFTSIFSNAEMEEIKQRGINRFYELWTKKEAITKAIGKGIVLPLKDINVNKEISNYNGINYNLFTSRLQNFYCSLAYTSSSIIPEKKWIQVQF